MLKGYSPSVSSYIQEVVTIAAGGNTTVAVTTNGTVYTVGANQVGQLGDSTLNDRYVPVKVVRGAAANSYDPNNYFLDKVTDVAVGNEHGIALRADGSIAAWGSNSMGQINEVPPTVETVDETETPVVPVHTAGSDASLRRPADRCRSQLLPYQGL